MEIKVEKKKITCTLNPKEHSYRPRARIHSPQTLSFRASKASVDDNDVICGACSETRLFFDPSPAKDIMSIAHKEGKAKKNRKKAVVSNDNVVVVEVEMESEEPFFDFRKSMEEIVGAYPHLLHDWGSLENLLACYLTVNGTHNHSYAAGAFVDLLINSSSSSSSLLG